jgi:hypothetical protein
MIEHPTTAPGGWQVSAIVLRGSPGEIAVALVSDGSRTMMALRWCDGNERLEPWSGSATEWFVLPYTFASAIGSSLAQIHAGGTVDFDEDGFSKMVTWLAENEGIDDGICY